jgi:hypothetical protein
MSENPFEVANELHARYFPATTGQKTLLLTRQELQVLRYALDSAYQFSGAFVSDSEMRAAWDSVERKVERNAQEAASSS